MYRRPSPLLAFLCVLLLLGAQQAAYAHWIEHIGSISSALSVSDRGKGSDNGDAAIHICTTCAAFAALDATPPAFIAQVAGVSAAANSCPATISAHIAARCVLAYAARAPPAVL